MKIKQINVKLEIGTTPKPYSSVKTGIELTASIPENENYEDAYQELLNIAQTKVLHALNDSVNKFLNKYPVEK